MLRPIMIYIKLITANHSTVQQFATIFFQDSLSLAMVCHDSTSMCASFSVFFSARPYVISGASLGIFERIQDDNIFCGSLLKLILDTCPAQRNWRLARYDRIGLRLSRFCKAAFVILQALVCFLVRRHMVLKQREWKQLSSCIRASVKHQDSEL